MADNPLAMKPSALQQPVRLDRWFWAVYFVCLPIVLWLSPPWKWDFPLYAKIAGGLLFPFLFSLAAYVLGNFLDIVFGRRALAKGEGKALLITAGFIAVAGVTESMLGVSGMILPGLTAFTAMTVFYISASVFEKR